MILSLSLWLVLIACAIAVVTDLRSRRVPNALTAALALAALTLHGFQGLAALALALAALVGVLLLGFIAFSLGWLGGGDVKLLAAVAGALSLPDAVPFLAYTAIGGGVLALAVAIAKGRLRSVFTSVGLVLRPFAYRGTRSVVPVAPIMLPYAVAIAFGAMVVALSHTSAPFLRLPL